MKSAAAGIGAAPWSLFRFNSIETGRQILELTRFLDANRPPLRSKTL
jgi:hypothetical protein